MENNHCFGILVGSCIEPNDAKSRHPETKPESAAAIQERKAATRNTPAAKTNTEEKNNVPYAIEHNLCDNLSARCFGQSREQINANGTMTTEKQYADALSKQEQCSMLASASVAANADADNAPVMTRNGWSFDALISMRVVPPNSYSVEISRSIRFHGFDLKPSVSLCQ